MLMLERPLIPLLNFRTLTGFKVKYYVIALRSSTDNRHDGVHGLRMCSFDWVACHPATNSLFKTGWRAHAQAFDLCIKSFRVDGDHNLICVRLTAMIADEFKQVKRSHAFDMECHNYDVMQA